MTADQQLATILQNHETACRLGLTDAAQVWASDWYELLIDTWDWGATQDSQSRRVLQNFWSEYAEEKRLDDRARARDIREALR